MQIQPNTNPMIHPPGHQHGAGRSDRAPEGIKPSGERIVLEHIPGNTTARVTDRAAMGETGAMSGELKGAPETHEGPPNGEVRKHLARLDQSVKQRLMEIGEEHGLDKQQLKALAKQFHQSVREAYSSFQSGDTVEKSDMMLEVRHAFELVRDSFKGMVRGAGEGEGVPGAERVSEVSGAVTESTAPGAVTEAPRGASETGLPPEPIVDPVVAGEVPGEQKTGVQVALDSLLARFENRMNLLEQLFGGENERDSSSGIYDALGVRDTVTLAGERIDETA